MIQITNYLIYRLGGLLGAEHSEPQPQQMVRALLLASDYFMDMADTLPHSQLLPYITTLFMH